MVSEVPTFSVVIPCFNYGHFLEATIESVLEQGRNDVEIILVDDASTDNTPQVAARFQQRITYIRNEQNQGAGGAWRTGIAKTSGTYVLKLDADDKLLPGHFDRVSSAFETDDQIGFVATSVLVYRENERVLKAEYVTRNDVTLEAGQLRNKLLRSFFFKMPGCVLRHEILRGHQLPDPDLYQIHDWEYFLRVTSGHKGRLLREPGAVYRVHDNSITATAQFDNRLFGDIIHWLEFSGGQGERQLPKEEENILRGSFGELLLIGFGPKLKFSSYQNYLFRYSKAVGISLRGGWSQFVRLHWSLARKIISKILCSLKPRPKSIVP